MDELSKELLEKLNQNVVEFKFTKANGEERLARGTRRVEEIGGVIPCGHGKPQDSSIPFWDVDKQSWRCCRVGSVTEIRSVTPIELYVKQNCEE